MEFIITTDMTTALPQSIDFNFEEQKAWLTERLEHYNGLVVTADTIKEGKEDRAKLNALKQAIEARRKEIKRDWLKPYNEFEAKVKELTALIDQPIATIDAQLKTYDEQRREEKRQQIAAAYDTIVPESIRDIIPLQTIWNPRWENATMQMKKVEEELEGRVRRTFADLLALDAVEEEYKAAVREVYIRTLDLGKALAHKTALQEAAEAFRQREAARTAVERQEPAKTANVQPAEETRQEAPKEAAGAALEEEETVYVLRLELQVTRKQAAQLKTFLNNYNINHRKI